METVLERTEALYRQDGARLWRAVFAYAGDRTVADDATAEAFTQLLRRGESVLDPAAWVWRSAFRIAAGELASRSRTELTIDGVAPDDLARVGVVTDAVEDRVSEWPLIVAALQTLSDQQRSVVILRDYVGHSSRATAEIIGSTEQSVRVQLMRARRSLRARLRP